MENTPMRTFTDFSDAVSQYEIYSSAASEAAAIARVAELTAEDGPGITHEAFAVDSEVYGTRYYVGSITDEDYEVPAPTTETATLASGQEVSARAIHAESDAWGDYEDAWQYPDVDGAHEALLLQRADGVDAELVVTIDHHGGREFGIAFPAPATN